MRPIRDVHSYANPGEARVTHAALELEVLFDRKILRGGVELAIERVDPASSTLRLDTRGLDVAAVETSRGGSDWAPARFELGEADPILGSPLTIPLRAGDDRVRVAYATRPAASGL